MVWLVGLNRKADKQFQSLSKKLRDQMIALRGEIVLLGPVRGNWPNYSKLGGDRHHCHITPKYVACWEVKDKKVQIVEIYYVGSRKDAPY